MKTKIPERSEIPISEQWATEDLYPSEAAWEEDFRRLEAQIAEAASYRGRLGGSAETLLSYLRLCDDVGQRLDSLYNYAQRRSDVDTRVPRYQAMSAKVQSLAVELRTKTAFDMPELLAIGEERLEEYYAALPALTLYRLHLERLYRRKKHILSDAEERILAAAGELTGAPETIYSMLADADLKFPDAVSGQGETFPLTQGTFVTLEQSEDRTLRRTAFENLYQTFGAYRNTFASVLNTQVKALEFQANCRGYESALHASLDQTFVPVSVYHSLIDTVHRNMELMHRYVRLRKKMLGVPELHFYDIYAPLVSGETKPVPFAQAKETVYEALAPLGEDYRAILREGFENRWIDVRQNVGKRSGAYSSGSIVHPYVLLNYSDDLEGQFTLAHEMGHAIHSYLSNRTQPPVYRDYVIFVAEVASTCNEALLMEHLLSKTTDRAERASLLNHFLEQFKGTLYRQTMFAEFELRLGTLSAQGSALTAEVLCDEYRELNRQYFGEDMTLDPEIALEWARIPHFYYNYYVFQYATGYAAAIALSRKILREGKPAADAYLRFLSGGCSRDPIGLLKEAGVDMTTSAPVEEALKLFGELLEEMEGLTL